MTDPPPLDSRGEELRRRWQVQPTPRNALYFAEELRRQGRLQEGLEVLRKTVESHPGHLAPRVALGRFHLELRQHAEAARALEGVVEEDPTHLVANKLLVELYLETGESKKARDRLDLYRLLNESDPEIESLESKLADRPAEEAPAAEASLEGPAIEAADLAEAETVMTPMESLSPRSESGAPPAAPPEEPAPARSEESAGVEPGATLEPAGTEREVPFSLPEVSPQAFDLGPARPVASVAQAPQPGPAVVSSAGEASAVFVADPERDPFQEIGGDIVLGEDRGRTAMEGIFPLTAGPAAAVAPAAEAWPETEVEEEKAVTEPAPAEPLETEPPAGFAEPLAAEPPPPVPEPPVPATATLAELYLEQGHLAEAEQAFREVLLREPDNDLARRRLAEIRRRRSPRLTAGELLVDAATGLEGVERRKHLLESYLRRIRSNAEADQA